MNSAILSSDGRYRYMLRRHLPHDLIEGPNMTDTVAFVMLNPSTADAAKDDPTIRKCLGFAKRWGFGAIMVANLFAYRATDPDDMIDAHSAGIDITGSQNHVHVEQVLRTATLVVAAWGGNAARLPDGLRPIVERSPGLQCLGRTKGGHPTHPLYVPYDKKLEPFA